MNIFIRTRKKVSEISRLNESGTIWSADGNHVEFRAGDTLLIPAAYEEVIRFADDTQYLTVTVPTR